MGPRCALVLLATIGLPNSLWVRMAHAEEPEGSEAEAEHAEADAAAGSPADRLLARVRYVRADYGDALEELELDGDADEYQEQRELLEEVSELAEGQPLSPSTRTLTGALASAVERKAPASEVESLCDGLVARLRAELWAEIAAPDASMLAEGPGLYAQRCASCHGRHGEGPPPGVDALDPAPVPLAAPEFAEGISPRRVYEAVTFGVPDTAMFPRAGELSPPERWAVAFYVANLWSEGDLSLPPPLEMGAATPAPSDPSPAAPAPEQTAETHGDPDGAAVALEAPPPAPAEPAAAGAPAAAPSAEARVAEAPLPPAAHVAAEVSAGEPPTLERLAEATNADLGGLAEADRLAALRSEVTRAAAASPWLAMRELARAGLDPDADTAFQELHDRWHAVRRQVAADDPALAHAADVALRKYQRTRERHPERSRAAAKALTDVLAKIEGAGI